MKDKILKQHTLYSVVLLAPNMMEIPTALLKEKQKRNHVELLDHVNETLAGTGLMATLTCTYKNKMVSYVQTYRLEQIMGKSSGIAIKLTWAYTLIV